MSLVRCGFISVGTQFPISAITTGLPEISCHRRRSEIIAVYSSSGYSATRLRPLPHSTQKGEKLSFLSLSVSLVGVTGFEPATSSSRTKRATKLRHTPRNSHIVGRPSVNLKITCLDFGGCHTKIRPETRKSHLEVKIRTGNYRGRARRPLPVARATIPAATPPRRGANFPVP